MKFAIGVLLGAIACLGSDVHVLTDETFDTFMKEHPISLVKFMAPWCGHCKRLAPEYEKAATDLKDEIPLAEVDAAKYTDLATRYGVTGYPTMFLFRDGDKEDYAGAPNRQGIVSWVKKMTGPSVVWVDSAAAAAELDVKGDPKFVAGFASKDSGEFKTFEQVAKKKIMSGAFVAYEEKDKKKQNQVTLKRPDEDEVSHKLQADDKNEFLKWVNEEKLPLFGAVSGMNYSDYHARSKEWVWFVGTKDQFTEIAPEVRKTAKDYARSMNFVWLDSDTHKSHAENVLGIKGGLGLCVAIESARYIYPDNAAKATHRELSKFIEKVKAGKVEKFLKTEAIPEENPGPVYTVVGQNFEDFVFKKDKDVLVEVYAPWCGHCKQLAPIYEEFAERMAANKHFVIAKIDGASNDIPEGFAFRGFPTIFFVKAGKKEPILYEGDRTMEGFIEFAKKNASQKVVVGEAKKVEKEFTEDQEKKDEL